MRHDDADVLRYASELDVSFDRIKERFDEYNPFAWLGDAVRNARVQSIDLTSAISEFMAQLNNDYFEDDPVEEVSFDEAMQFNG